MITGSAEAGRIVQGVHRKRTHSPRMNPTETVWTAESNHPRSDRMSKRTLPVLGAFALAAGLFALLQLAGRAGDGDVKPVVPAAAMASMVADDIKIVNEALKEKDGKAPLPKDVKRAKVAALDIALTAKASKNDALYGQAMQVLEALAKEDGVPDARKAAAGLSKPTGGDAKGDAIKLALWDSDNKSWDKDLAMQFFKTPRAGGLGFEKIIKDYAEKDPPANKLNEIMAMSHKIAMLSQAIQKVGPDTTAGPGKTPEAWKKFAEILQKTALEVAAAAGSKKPAEVKAALGRMDTSCVNCHEKFKTTP